jgi:iron complex outermembrane receptor protein
MTYVTYNRGFKAGGVNIDANGAGTRANNPAEVPGGVPLSPVYKPETINAYEFGAKIDYLGGRGRTNLALFYYDIAGLQIAQFVGLRTTVINAGSATDYGAEIENRFRISDGLSVSASAMWIPHARYGRDAQIDPLWQAGASVSRPNSAVMSRRCWTSPCRRS